MDLSVYNSQGRTLHILSAVLFVILSALSALILARVKLRIWRISSWVFGRNWPQWLLGPQLEPLVFVTTVLCIFLAVSPALLLIAWGAEIRGHSENDQLVPLALVLCGPAFVSATYALFLWKYTKWQSSRAVTTLLYLSIGLLCAYEAVAVQRVTQQARKNDSGFFFGASAIALALNMLPIICMAFNGDGGLDIDEYVKRAYVYARATCIQIQQDTIDPQPPDLKDPSLYASKSKCRRSSGVSCYLLSVAVLAFYSVVYWKNAKYDPEMGAVTSVTVLVLDWVIGSCVFTLMLIQNRIQALALAFVARCLLISCGVSTWYLGHCLAYAVVASVLLGSSVAKWYPVVSATESRQKELASTVEALRLQYWQRGQGQTMTRSMFSGSLTNTGMNYGSFVGSEVGRQMRVETAAGVPYEQQGEDAPGELSFSGLQGLTNREDGYVFDKGKTNYRGRTGRGGVVWQQQPTGELDCSRSYGGCLQQEEVGRGSLPSNEGQGGQKEPFRDGVLKEGRGLARGGGGENGSQQSGLEMTARERGEEREPVGGDNVSAGAERCSRMVEGGTDLRARGTGDESTDAPSWCDMHWSTRYVLRTPAGVWAIFSLIFVVETVVVRLRKASPNSSVDDKELKCGVAALLLPPIVASTVAYHRSLRACRWRLVKKPLIIGTTAAALTLAEGLFVATVVKSAIILAFAITLPFLGISLSIATPMWIQNGCKFFRSDKPEPLADKDESSRQLTQNPEGVTDAQGTDSGEMKRSLYELPFAFRQNLMMVVCIVTCILSVIAVALIIWWEPFESSDANSESFYTRPAYLGSAIASSIAMILLIWLPCVSWFSTYRISPSMIACLTGFVGVLLGFCAGSYALIRKSRGEHSTVDLLAAFLPLLCIPAIVLLLVSLYKWKDDGWKVSQGLFRMVVIGWLLLAAVTLLIGLEQWQVAGLFMFVLLLLFLGMVVAYRWVSNHFYLSRREMVSFSSISMLLALAAFLFGIKTDQPLLGASVGLFVVVVLLAGYALLVLCSPVRVVYSPRVLPVFVYDAAADKVVDVSGSFLILYGVALAVAVWGVIASVKNDTPFLGVAVSMITLVLALAFFVSRPGITLKMVEDALEYLKDDRIACIIAECSAQTRRHTAGAVSSSHRSLTGFSMPLVGDTSSRLQSYGSSLVTMHKLDLAYLRQQLSEQEAIAGNLLVCKAGKATLDDGSIVRQVSMGSRMMGSCARGRTDEESGWLREPESAPAAVDSYVSIYEKKVAAHCRILELEEMIDTQWAEMWGKFGGRLLLLLALAARAERVQDEVRLRCFLDAIGFKDVTFKDVTASKIRKWNPETRRRFEKTKEWYLMQKEQEDISTQARREKAELGKSRRLARLENERRRSADATTLLPSNILNKSFHRDSGTDTPSHRILSRLSTKDREARARKIGVADAVCLVDDRPRSAFKIPHNIDPKVTGATSITISAALVVPVGMSGECIFGIEILKGQELGCCIETTLTGDGYAQLGLRLVWRGPEFHVLSSDYTIGQTKLADGRWHCVAMVLDGPSGLIEAYVDGAKDGSRPHVSLPWEGGIPQSDVNFYIGKWPDKDEDALEQSSTQGTASWSHGRGLTRSRSLSQSQSNVRSHTGSMRMRPGLEVMDVILWGRALMGEEIWNVHKMTVAEGYAIRPPPPQPYRENSQVGIYEENSYVEGMEAHVGRADSSSCNLQGAHISLEEEQLKEAFRRHEEWVRAVLCEMGETRFTDADFPPDDSSLFINPQRPLPKLQAVKDWMRPDSVFRKANKKPSLFSGPAKPQDVRQGGLGDCWFLSAVAVLTEECEIKDVVITPEYNEMGVYTFRFCIQGEWQPVIVDDWIPVNIKGKPVFATSKKEDELWLTLLEKAYAKLHGSYEALEGGVVQDALVDLTGGAGEEIDMRNTDRQLEIASGRLWSQLMRFKEEGFLLGAGSPAGSDTEISPHGIVQSHAYSLLQVREVDGHKLLQMRNPWGNGEWSGPWSDSSSEWTERMKYKLKYTPKLSDGVFWMSWEDFQVHFRSVYVCRLYPPGMRKVVHGEWRGPTAGGCPNYDTWQHNPQFLLRGEGVDAHRPINVFMTLAQNTCGRQPFFIGLRVVRKGGERAAPCLYVGDLVGASEYINTREVACEMVLEPDPRGYTIVPTTHSPGQETSFRLSVFTKASVRLHALS